MKDFFFVEVLDEICIPRFLKPIEKEVIRTGGSSNAEV